MTKKENIFLRIMESESDMRKIYFQLDLSVRFPAVPLFARLINLDYFLLFLLPSLNTTLTCFPTLNVPCFYYFNVLYYLG